MATNVSFFVQIEDSSGNVLFKKDIDPASELTFTKDGGAYLPGSKTNNGDGSYYFTITESGKYSLLINGIEQDEFKDTYIAAEDSLTEQNIDGTPTKGQVILNSDILEIQDAATIVLESEIVNNLVSTDTDKALSAAQGKTLKDVQDLQLLISNIVNDLVSSDTDKPLSALQGKNLQDAIALDFANAYYINDDKTISTNLERLDSVLRNLALSANIQSYRTIYKQVQEATTAANNSITATAYDTFDNTSGTAQYKAKGKFFKRANDTKIIVTAMCELSSGSMADADLRLSLDTPIGTDETTTSITYQGGGAFEYQMIADLSAYTDNEFLEWGVGCYVGTPAGGTLDISNVQVEVRTN